MTLPEWRALYRELGFATVPLAPRGKRPLRRGWLTRSDEQWDHAPADANLGVLTGSRSGGLVVLDFDARDGPERVLGMTPEQLAVITIVVETARGWHVYARGEATTGTPCEGLDVRAEGGMVVAPPSVHPSGHVYRFAGACRTPVALDALTMSADPVKSLATEEVEPAADPRLAAAEKWIALQAPKLREAWGRLRAPVSGSWDASRADFAVSRCLWEGGWSEEEVVAVLMALPGSRARERGESYARLTVARAVSARPRRV